ncbi:ABC transporter substrate-binding protein [Cupriavidus oxalaticus]|jgi:ABC-type nitrate/sulfonate/bicarbonate transport system substrate-binding protein|uniref:ABC transporter substrate-binding protein n=1 Tax=Cupriavidus oxalaticus TaxID=96344 RepID=A0A375GGS5_9BURK|nr:ABC transporter substrate-binding protein [Cupriavidus oxalaticus]QEZ44916.1 ABC transporter substrate-binding protein [Cupriavidus oxalaticus]QRQ83711.1 ABC transporter substrate-binding protein [Cupriavidus oxalaticus]QRQ92200.1 ABC transporter substrate-binding protein [Cupriavidus oxalaticus]WQD86810.1 ABC transporter substrate-binding protein [Cupriavidus oxalaticus]SPC05508.1 conserved exported hypothetical protein [Cupriavidus oxalaticus]
MGVRLKMGAAMVCLLALGAGAQTAPQTVRIQTYAGSTGPLQAVVASAKGFCGKHGIECELKVLNSGPLGMQTLVGKTIDVAMPEINAAIASAAGGADVQLLSGSVARPIFTLVARSDVKLPNLAKGYPAVMHDLKGMKIGVTARGAGSELQLVQLLRSAGMSAADVTMVPVGGPGTAYAALVTGKQVDALMMFQPVKTLCAISRNCVKVVDPAAGEGPADVLAQDGASTPFVARREWIEANPRLVTALLAAFADAEAWAKKPENFEELVRIYEPITPLKVPDADAIRRSWLKDSLAVYSLNLKRSAVQAAIRQAEADKLITRHVDVARFVSSHAPQ